MEKENKIKEVLEIKSETQAEVETLSVQEEETDVETVEIEVVEEVEAVEEDQLEQIDEEAIKLAREKEEKKKKQIKIIIAVSLAAFIVGLGVFFNSQTFKYMRVVSLLNDLEYETATDLSSSILDQEHQELIRKTVLVETISSIKLDDLKSYYISYYGDSIKFEIEDIRYFVYEDSSIAVGNILIYYTLTNPSGENVEDTLLLVGSTSTLNFNSYGDDREMIALLEKGTDGLVEYNVGSVNRVEQIIEKLQAAG